jgi:hypothetical protein
MTRAEKIRKLAAAIQDEIVSCPNEQSFDEGIIWISGSPTSLADLLMDHNVPEDMEEEIVNKLRCPECEGPLELWQDVGTKHGFEHDHDWTLEAALDRYGEKLFEFYGFLHKFPMLGATHRFGRIILRELKRAPRVPLHKPRWFRARRTKEYGFGPTPQEFVGDQRYNTSGHPCWYFSDTAEAAVAETTHSLKEPKAWVQEFQIDNFTGLLDLRSWKAEDDRAFNSDGNYQSPHESLIVALIYSDLLTQWNEQNTPDDKPKERQWKREYLLTRFVSQAALAAGFNGILCSSVRHHAENLIVFDAGWNPAPVGDPFELELDQSAIELRDSFFWNHGEASYLPKFDDPLFQ